MNETVRCVVTLLQQQGLKVQEINSRTANVCGGGYVEGLGSLRLEIRDEAPLCELVRPIEKVAQWKREQNKGKRR